MQPKAGYGFISTSDRPSAIAQAEGVVRQSQVEREVSDLEYAANRVEDSLSRLAGRLSSVLPSVNAMKSEPAPEEMLVPLADQIRSTRKRFENIERQLNALSDLIEL